MSDAPALKPTPTGEFQELPWLVIYTKPRQEKKLAERLQQAGYTVYCPTQRMKKRWSDRWKWIEQPLFSSHIFIQIDPERRDAIYFVPGFVRFLFWLKRPAQVRPKEIEILKRWLNDYAPEAISTSHLQPGQKTKVLTGPFQGQEGTLQEVKAERAQLYLEELQLLVELDLSKNELLVQ